jgi:hypothetical protein
MMSETATTFRVGDRVRVKRYPADVLLFDSMSLSGKLAWFSNGQEALVEDCELVERAHYAPPGVAMLALTPEVLEALEDAHGSILVAHAESCYYKKECDCEKNHRILELAIAAAQKEVSK